MTVEIKIQGVGEIQQNINALAKRLSYREVSSVLLRGARTVAKVAKATTIFRDKTGNLRRAIIAKALPDRGIIPVAIVAVAREKKAHHVHLVEQGTVAREHESGKKTGKMPALPFLEPAWEYTQDAVLAQVLLDLKNKVENT